MRTFIITFLTKAGTLCGRTVAQVTTRGQAIAIARQNMTRLVARYEIEEI